MTGIYLLTVLMPTFALSMFVWVHASNHSPGFNPEILKGNFKNHVLAEMSQIPMLQGIRR